MNQKKNKGDLRARLFGGRSALRSERVRINAITDDSGSPLEVEIRGLMAGRAFEIKRASRDEEGGDDPAKSYPALLIETVYVPGTDELVFGPGDRDSILQMPSEIVEQLARIATDLSGIGDTGYKAVEKNSAAAAPEATAATPTDLPSASE